MEFLDLDESRLNDPKYIELLKYQMQQCSSIEQSSKLALNSIYGALANKWFFWKNIDLAEAVTLQGQDEIRITENLVNDYFYNIFPTQRHILRLLGVPDDVEIKLYKPVVIYIDTDSCFFDTNIDCLEDIYSIELEDGSIKELKSFNKVKLNTGEIKYVKNLNENDDIIEFL